MENELTIIFMHLMVNEIQEQMKDEMYIHDNIPFILLPHDNRYIYSNLNLNI